MSSGVHHTYVNVCFIIKKKILDIVLRSNNMGLQCYMSKVFSLSLSLSLSLYLSLSPSLFFLNMVLDIFFVCLIILSIFFFCITVLIIFFKKSSGPPPPPPPHTLICCLHEIVFGRLTLDRRKVSRPKLQVLFTWDCFRTAPLWVDLELNHFGSSKINCWNPFSGRSKCLGCKNEIDLKLEPIREPR